MNTLINYIRRQINTLRDWWNTNHQQLRQSMGDSLAMLFDDLGRLTVNIMRLMIIGFVLNIIANSFYPELPERFPAIYGWFNGWLQVGEFAVKTVFMSIYSLFTGHWTEFWIEYNEAVGELIQQFVNWLSSLHF